MREFLKKYLLLWDTATPQIHCVLTAIFPGAPGLACWPLKSPSPFIPKPCILRDRSKLSMSSLTQSHQVFYGRHLCLIPSTFNVMHFTQSLSSLCLTCPNHLKLLFVIIKLTRSNSNSSLSSVG